MSAHASVWHVFFNEVKLATSISKKFPFMFHQDHFDFVAISQRPNYIFVLQIQNDINFIIQSALVIISKRQNMKFLDGDHLSSVV